ncbi:DUF5615 family PIN-like protein [Bacteroidota bacterium]
MIIADENINSLIIDAIRDIGVDVISIREDYPGISDEEVMKLSINPPRIILTEDKDFGEWVFAHNIKNISVIFLRYRHTDLLKIILALQSLLKKGSADLFGTFITLTLNKVRIRKLT